MRVTMQNDIDIIGRHIGRNMFQPKSQTRANKIDNQRPLGIAVAVSAHNRDRSADRAQLVRNDFRAHVAEMPDLVRLAGKIDNFRRQLVMSVRNNKNFHRVRGGSAAPGAMLKECGFAAINNIERRSARSTLSKHSDCFPTICSLVSNRVVQ